MFSPDDPDRFAPIVQSLLEYDHFMVAADFDAYWDAQRAIDRLWQAAGRLVAQVHPEYRAHGLVLVGPHHPRIRARYLGHRARLGRAAPPHDPVISPNFP